MKNVLLMFMILAGFLMTAFMGPVTAQQSVIESDSLLPQNALRQALRGIKMTPADLVFRTDYVELDSFRMEIIDSLTRYPLGLPAYTSHIAGKFFTDKLKLCPVMIVPSKQYDQPEPAHIAPPPIDYPDDMKPEDIVLMDQLVTETFEFIELSYYYDTPDYFIELEDSQIAFIRDTFPELILEDVEDEFRPVEELDSLQKLGEEYLHRALQVCRNIRMEDIMLYHAMDILAFERYLTMTADLQTELDHNLDLRNWQIEKNTPYGKFAFGGFGDNFYEGEYAYICDLGGDDQYSLAQVSGSQILIDYSGNDIYIGRDDYCLASGRFGISALIDYEGDDLYKAGNFSIASGLFGIGLLIDSSGNDTYLGDTHTQGAATFGIGILQDRNGNDNYNCALFGQAFAGVQGYSALADISGNDNYFAGGKYKDFLRYDDHYLSLSQGFSFGFRPRMSGGIAFLIDSSGHDIYTSDIFGQGASYWYGLGALYDLSGNDKYFSFQYAQGNGTHLSLGILMDGSGEDYYYAKGVSQGCGHDLAAGILIDYDGNDTYQAYDLCQAAGSANGIGLFIDYRGRDTYEVQKTHNTQGYGNPRRDYGSVGVFIDLMGEDNYFGNGQNNHYWIIESRWGIGMDLDYWKDGEEAEDEDN